jgi:iron complex transport system permease protein
VVLARTSFRCLCASVVLLLCLALVAGVLIGVTMYTPMQFLEDEEVQQIVVHLRLPRVLCSLLVGGGLALVGVAYQALFRNHLASPFTLGVSSGAALCSSAAIVLGLTTSQTGIDVGMYALLGALLSIGFIVGISAGFRHRYSHSVLLVGIVFSFFCSSAMTLIQYLADYSQLFQITRWLMGGIPTVSWRDLAVGVLCFVGIVAWLWTHSGELDLMLFGDDLATVKGLDPIRFSRITFVLSSFFVGWVVAQCGIIGFVGIVVPAIARILVGVSHARVLPISLLLGALLVVLCDVLGRVLIAPFEIPAGVFTSVIGGPIFVLLLLAEAKRGTRML